MGQRERCDETIAGVASVGLRPDVGLNVAFAATKHDDTCDLVDVGLGWVGLLKGAQDSVTHWKNRDNASRKDCNQTKRLTEPHPTPVRK